MGVSNCLIFALWRWVTRGGYLILRRSHHGWWPHVLWSSHLRNAEIEHYVPRRYSQHFAPFHKILFRGDVSRADRLKPMTPAELLGLKPEDLPPDGGQRLGQPRRRHL